MTSQNALSYFYPTARRQVNKLMEFLILVVIQDYNNLNIPKWKMSLKLSEFKIYSLV